jgi:hypothetical protein
MCIHNLNARDAEYFLRGYNGGALLRSPSEFDFSDIFDLANAGVPLSVILYNLSKILGYDPFASLRERETSEPGGTLAAYEGWYKGFIGMPISLAIEQYGTIPLSPFPPPDISSPTNPILPNGQVTNFIIDDAGTTADLSIFTVSVNANESYFFDPSSADGYSFAVTGGNAIRSVIVPSGIGLTDLNYTIGVDDLLIHAQVGTVIDFPAHGFPDGVEGFVILDLNVPEAVELVTGLTFTQSGNTVLGEVSMYRPVDEPPTPASDTAPPVITISATPTTLWPPNGKKVPVTISGTMTDPESGVNASSAAYTVTDEYGLVQPSGQVSLGSNGSYSLTVQLQASRNGNDKDGRRYTISVTTQDNAGNKGSGSAIVTVPHDQGK